MNLGDVEIHETSLVSLLEDRPWVLSSSVIVGSDGDDLVLGELLRQLEELLLLRSDVEAEARRGGCCCCLWGI